MSHNEEHQDSITYNDTIKKAIYKYKETHPEKWKEQQRKNQKSYYQKNKEKCKEKSRLSYKNKQEELIYLRSLQNT